MEEFSERVINAAPRSGSHFAVGLKGPATATMSLQAGNKFTTIMKNIGDSRRCRRQDKLSLRTASRSKFEAIFGFDMRPLFSILSLLLCLIAAGANELPVIKDSEAAQYVGKTARFAV